MSRHRTTPALLLFIHRARAVRPRRRLAPRIGVGFAAALTVTASIAPAQAAPIRVACVGDSITQGSGASTPAHTWPAVLATLAGSGWDVRNFGNSGKTMIKLPRSGSSYWSTTQYTASQTFAPDIVTLMLGTNDSKTANWNGGTNTYQADYVSLVHVYQALPSHPTVFAILPPPAYPNSLTISPTVIQNEILPIIRTVAHQTAIGIIDVNAAFEANQPQTLLTADGVHPNDTGYVVLAQTVWAAIRQVASDGGLVPGDASSDAAVDARVGADSAEDALAPSSDSGPAPDDSSARGAEGGAATSDDAARAGDGAQSTGDDAQGLVVDDAAPATRGDSAATSDDGAAPVDGAIPTGGGTSSSSASTMGSAPGQGCACRVGASRSAASQARWLTTLLAIALFAPVARGRRRPLARDARRGRDGA